MNGDVPSPKEFSNTAAGWVHYDDVIMTMLASQITSLTVVYSIVYSGVNQKNIKTPRHWPLCGKFTGDRWISRINGQLRGKCFHLMTSSWTRKKHSLQWSQYRQYCMHTFYIWHNEYSILRIYYIICHVMWTFLSKIAFGLKSFTRICPNALWYRNSATGKLRNMDTKNMRNYP